MVAVARFEQPIGHMASKPTHFGPMLGACDRCPNAGGFSLQPPSSPDRSIRVWNFNRRTRRALSQHRAALLDQLAQAPLICLPFAGHRRPATSGSRDGIENDRIGDARIQPGRLSWMDPQSPNREVLSQPGQPQRGQGQAQIEAQIEAQSQAENQAQRPHSPAGSLIAPPLAKGLNTLQDRGERENLGAAYIAS